MNFYQTNDADTIAVVQNFIFALNLYREQLANLAQSIRAGHFLIEQDGKFAGFEFPESQPPSTGFMQSTFGSWFPAHDNIKLHEQLLQLPKPESFDEFTTRIQFRSYYDPQSREYVYSPQFCLEKGIVLFEDDSPPNHYLPAPFIQKITAAEYKQKTVWACHFYSHRIPIPPARRYLTLPANHSS